MDAVRRERATEATKEEFFGTKFKYGRNDCAQVARKHAIRCGCAFNSSEGGNYSTPLGAKRALTRMGYENLRDLMDKNYEVIAPARALPGDIIELEGDEVIGTLVVYLGNQKALSFHETQDAMCIVQILEPARAWRMGKKIG